MPSILSLIYIFLFALPAFCAEPYTLEKIVVRADGASVSDGSLKKNYPFQTFNSQEIEEKNLDSLADILDYVSGMDLRSRSGMGIQGDLSLRGSGFEQVAVLIDGIRVMDPQTGHHNLDIPLTVFDIERVEVTKEGVSSLHGSGAFAGSVNFITKKPVKKALNLDTLFGENALFGQAASFSLPAENFSTRVSFDHRISKAARPNTDFEYRTASFYLTSDWGKTNLATLFGYQKKDFGADSFYSNLFPEEEEHTETVFVKSQAVYKSGFGSIENNLSYRRHRDKFILKRNNPVSVNYHTTHVYGLDSKINLALRYGELSLGIDTGRDEIHSTNLGRHARLHEAGYLGFVPELPGRFSSDFRLRVDHYQELGIQESYNLGLGYEITEKIRVKGSLARAFRMPSFTELFYSDAANAGNPNLKTEESDSVSLGLDYKEERINFGLSGFFRRGSNLIDWTRVSQLDRWQATNLGKVDFEGIEFSAGLKPGFKSKGLDLRKIIFSYNYMQAEHKAGGFISKYALDILKDQFILDIYCGILGADLTFNLSYNRRQYGETYFLGSIYLGKKFRANTLTFEPFVKIDNFSNVRYTEVAGVLQPARWVTGGLKFEW